MPSTTSSSRHSDLLVVGAGILGLATAYLAHRDGYSVHVIDRSDHPVGSSIQNFGHACFTGQADVVQGVAADARSGWLQAAKDAGFWARESGTYIPAMTNTEVQVIDEFAEHRGVDQVRLLSRAEIANAIGNPDLAAKSGAFLPTDVRVDPRQAAPALARWLMDQGVRFTWSTQVTEVGDGAVGSTRGNFTAQRVIVCPGFQLAQLFPSIAEKHNVRVCSLVMSLVDRPTEIPDDLALLTGTSLARYDGFAAMPSVPALREELTRNEPDLVNCVANLMVTGTPTGLFIGDSHAYSATAEPFIDEDIAELLLNKATAILGMGSGIRSSTATYGPARVRQRWLGRYADSPDTNLIIERPDPQTTVLAVTSGIGMTLSFGVAKLALEGGRLPGF